MSASQPIPLPKFLAHLQRLDKTQLRFVVEALHELYASEQAKTPDYYEITTAQWARSWPAEDLWTAQLMR